MVGTNRSGTMEQVAKQVSQHESERRNRGFRFIPSVGRSAVKAEKLARLHAYDLDPSPYGSWIVVPPRKHATRTAKQRNLQSSRAVNGKVNIV